MTDHQKKMMGNIAVTTSIQFRARHLEKMLEDGRSRRAIVEELLEWWRPGQKLPDYPLQGGGVASDSVAPPAPVVPCAPTPEELESREESQRKAAAKMDVIEAALEKRGLTLWDYSGLTPEEREALVPLSGRV